MGRITFVFILIEWACHSAHDAVRKRDCVPVLCECEETEGDIRCLAHAPVKAGVACVPRSGVTHQVMRFFASGGFFAKYLRMPLRTASAIWSW
jgi:hypothetical protein